jgi:hypothetical protein
VEVVVVVVVVVRMMRWGQVKVGWELTVLHLALGVAEPVDCCPMPTAH